MGKVHFPTKGGIQIPFQANTGQTVECVAKVVNDDMPTVPMVVPSCVHCKIEVRIASDSEGKNIIMSGEREFDACCLNWAGEVTEVHVTFTMPSCDIWISFILYQLKDNQWVLADSTAFLGIDNPAWPPPLWGFWNWKFLGIELYKWAIILGSVTVAGVLIARSRS